MDTLANINGQCMPLAEVKISALDRGFLFGDAVYEVLRVYQGRPWLEQEHFGRLKRSLHAIQIYGVDVERLRSRMHETIAAGPFNEAIVYIQITRGAAPRTHAFPKDAVPLELLYVQPFVDPYTEARNAGASVISARDIRWERCDIKSTNLLANVLAMQHAKESGCLEAIYHLPDGTLTEGTHTSLFGVLDGSMLTAPKTNAILPGITRGLVLRLAEMTGIPVREHRLSLSQLGQVSELFLTGTTTEVLPVVRVDSQPIGSGHPGPVTRKLQESYARSVRDFLATAP
jgi:D-alanine transaminase